MRKEVKLFLESENQDGYTRVTAIDAEGNEYPLISVSGEGIVVYTTLQRG